MRQADNHVGWDVQFLAPGEDANLGWATALLGQPFNTKEEALDNMSYLKSLCSGYEWRVYEAVSTKAKESLNTLASIRNIFNKD